MLILTGCGRANIEGEWEEYQLLKKIEKSPQAFEQFAFEIVRKLYSFTPDGYDLSGLEEKVSPKVMEIFRNAEQTGAEQRHALQKSQTWQPTEIRRFYDSQASEWIVILVRGTRQHTESNPALAVLHFQQIEPSRENEYGLQLAGIYEEKNASKRDVLWKKALRLDAPMEEHLQSWKQSHLEHALRLTSGGSLDSDHWARLGRVCESLDKWDDAKVVYRRMKENWPQDERGWTGLMRTYAHGWQWVDVASVFIAHRLYLLCSWIGID